MAHNIDHMLNSNKSSYWTEQLNKNRFGPLVPEKLFLMCEKFEIFRNERKPKEMCEIKLGVLYIFLDHRLAVLHLFLPEEWSWFFFLL